MEQVKLFLAGIKRYHFWILCVLVVMVGVGTWWMSVSGLMKDITKNSADIKSKEKEVKNVSSIQNHPNNQYLEEMDKIIAKYKLGIAVGWRTRYQQQEKLLVWPKSLTEEFIDQVNPLRPIEKIPYPTPPDQELDLKYIEIYRNFITPELPKLAETIGSTWKAEVSSKEGGAGASGYAAKAPVGGAGLSRDAEEVEAEPIVYWNPQNQQDLLDTHFPFVSRGGKPTTLEILYAQEDLWVLQAIMNIIQKTNRDATANYEAAVKEISSIQIGRTVRGRMGKISPISLAQGANAVGGMGPGGAPGASPGMPAPGAGGAGPGAPTPGMPAGPGMGSPGMPGTTDAKALDPALGRYVDVNYLPLDPTTLRDAPKSDNKDLAIYSVAKRIPIRMRLFIDQRSLNDLLAECGNSSLPVEVRQVRINCPEGLASDDGSAAAGGAIGGGMMGAGAPKTGGYGGGGAGGAGGGASARRSGRKKGGAGGGYGEASGLGAGKESTADPNEIEVEIYGIVYIYNPVNEQQLKVELQQDSAPVGTPAEPTAATTDKRNEPAG